MRRLVMVLAVSLLVSACSGTPPPPSQHVEMTAYLAHDVTPEQRQAAEAAIKGLPGVTDVRHESREEAYAKFKELFKDSEEMVESVRPEEMPESFRFRLPDNAAAKAAEQSLASVPGITSIINTPTLKRPAANDLQLDQSPCGSHLGRSTDCHRDNDQRGDRLPARPLSMHGRERHSGSPVPRMSMSSLSS